MQKWVAGSLPLLIFNMFDAEDIHEVKEIIGSMSTSDF